MGYEIPESDTVISGLVRSFKWERPIPVKHVVEWDVHLVLKYLDLKQFSDMNITLKTVFLLALATGKRRSEIHALFRDVRWLSGNDHRVEISPVPSFMIKTHVSTNGLGALRPITLSALPESQEEGVGTVISCGDPCAPWKPT